MKSVEEVFEAQHFILGPTVERLEVEVSRLVECEFAIACASGSDALLLGLMALGIGPGDEVITTPYTFGATVGSIVRLGARPVFVDINPVTYNLDPSQIAGVINSSTKAIMPVHLFGLSAEMESIQQIALRHGLPIIEDAAQAICAKYQGQAVGSLGTIGCFSFFPSKNLGGAGDGGIVTTKNSVFADRLKIQRVHGCRRKYEYEMVGINSRLDALQAAVLLVKLRHLADWTEARRRNASLYQRLFTELGLQESVTLPVESHDYLHVYNQFVIRVANRDALREHLSRSGIPTEIYYPSPLHIERAYAFLGYKLGDFPNSERASRENLALPIFAELTELQQRAVVGSIAQFFASDKNREARNAR
jgi:dTDP-4-amino-4,6-dideoxygalactose transaminase